MRAILVLDGHGAVEKCEPVTTEHAIVLLTHATLGYRTMLVDAGLHMYTPYTGAIEVYARLGTAIRLGPTDPPFTHEARMCWCTLPSGGYAGPAELAFVLLQQLTDVEAPALVQTVSTALNNLDNWLAVSTIAAASIPRFLAASVPLKTVGSGLTAFAHAASAGIDFANVRTPASKLGVSSTVLGGKSPRLMFASRRGRFPATYSVSTHRNALIAHLDVASK